MVRCGVPGLRRAPRRRRGGDAIGARRVHSMAWLSPRPPLRHRRDSSSRNARRYGWHFPEMARLVNDNVHYAELVRKVRDRTNFKNSRDVVTEILDDDETAAQTLLDTAEMSMGTEVDPSDMDHVVALADQVVELSAYRTRLADYLRARMQALAPNLTTLVGELVGARLVQHAGSIMNLAKQPASICVEIKYIFITFCMVPYGTILLALC